jgi:hypothetical protein
MRNVAEKLNVEKIEANILPSINFFPENCAVYEIMWKNMVEPDRPKVRI